jgi:hypothetical protein
LCLCFPFSFNSPIPIPYHRDISVESVLESERWSWSSACSWYDDDGGGVKCCKKNARLISISRKDACSSFMFYIYIRTRPINLLRFFCFNGT